MMTVIRALQGTHWHYLCVDKNYEPLMYGGFKQAYIFNTEAEAALVLNIIKKLPSFTDIALELHVMQPAAVN